MQGSTRLHSIPEGCTRTISTWLTPSPTKSSQYILFRSFFVRSEQAAENCQGGEEQNTLCLYDIRNGNSGST